VHPRITIHPNAFPRTDSLAEDLDHLRRLEMPRSSLHSRKLEATGQEAARELARASGIEFTHVIHAPMFTLERADLWDGERARLEASIDTAAAVGAPLLYGTTGPAGPLEWDEAIGRLDEALDGPREHAAERGIELLFETTNPQYHDIDCLHTARDTLVAAERLRTGVCLDLHASWTEPDLARTIDRAAPLTRLVQVADYAPGTRTLARATPGDGIVPLERLLARVLATGYAGDFDLELVDNPPGPPGDAALTRGVTYLGALLDRAERHEPAHLP
jgi:sugar phosphate isomerase/epimerase